jgi:hypothetical protein
MSISNITRHDLGNVEGNVASDVVVPADDGYDVRRAWNLLSLAGGDVPRRRATAPPEPRELR